MLSTIFINVNNLINIKINQKIIWEDVPTFRSVIIFLGKKGLKL